MRLGRLRSGERAVSGLYDRLSDVSLDALARGDRSVTSLSSSDSLDRLVIDDSGVISAMSLDSNWSDSSWVRLESAEIF